MSVTLGQPVIPAGELANIVINQWPPPGYPRIVKSALAVEYAVEQADGLFNLENETLLQFVRQSDHNRRQLLVVDDSIDRIYGAQVRRYYDHHEISATVLALPVSESSKSLETTMLIVDALEEFNTLRRSNPIIALGGGVLLDLVGFAAGMYRRGVPYVRIPTNLMGLIDAGLAIKTGINIADRRNRLGSYWPPVKALLDRRFLATVDQRNISNGLGEILKIAVIKDLRLFQLLEHHGVRLLQTKLQEDDVAPEVIRRSVNGMLDELAPNLWELNLERCVDFGHSFSPLVEMRALPNILHGEAVALDVLLSCHLAAGRGLMSAEEVGRVDTTIKSLGLPNSHPLFCDIDLLWEALADTARHRDGLQRLPLPRGIGQHTFVNNLNLAELRKATECAFRGT